MARRVIALLLLGALLTACGNAGAVTQSDGNRQEASEISAQQSESSAGESVQKEESAETGSTHDQSDDDQIPEYGHTVLVRCIDGVIEVEELDVFNEYAFSPMYITNSVVSGTYQDMGGPYALFYNLLDEDLRYYDTYPNYLPTGQIAVYPQDKVPFIEQIGMPEQFDKYVYLLDEDLEFSSIQLIDFSDPGLDTEYTGASVFGLGYDASTNYYVMVYSEKFQFDDSPLRITTFDSSGKQINEPLVMPELTIYVSLAGSNIYYFSILPYKSKMLIFGGKVRQGTYLLFDSAAQSYEVLDEEQARACVDEMEEYIWCEYDDVMQIEKSPGVLRVIQEPPFTIEHRENGIALIEGDGAELTLLPDSYYLVDWEPLENGYQAIFHSEEEISADFGEYIISLQPWDSRAG